MTWRARVVFTICKTGHFASLIGRERQRNVQNWEFHMESVQKFCFLLLTMQICNSTVAVVVVFAYNSSVVTHKRWNCCVSWSWKESNKSSVNNSCRDAIIRWRPTFDLLLSSLDPITKFGWSATELHWGHTCELEKWSWQLPFSTEQSEIVDLSCLESYWRWMKFTL